jgi:hypothetical protein
MRRARRAMRRRGSNDPFQLVILGPDEPLGLIALEAAARWAWRHRTAFAPTRTAKRFPQTPCSDDSPSTWPRPRPPAPT